MTDFQPDIWSAVLISLKVGAWATFLGLPCAILMGWVLAKTEFKGKAFISTICLAPAVLPPVVTGFLLLNGVGIHSTLGELLSNLGIQIPFSLAGAVLAAWVVGLPFYIIGTRQAFESVDPELENLSKTMGYSPLETFFHVTLPLAAPGICAGAVLCFARSLGEFGATAVIAGNMEGHTRTISLAVYSLMESPNGEGQIKTLVWISLGLTFLALVAYECLTRWQRSRLQGYL